MNKRGFTLIELLAVLVVLALISGIAIFSVGGSINKSKNALSSVQIENIKQAAKTYYLKEGMSELEFDSKKYKTCVDVKYLVENGYVENEIINPNDGEEMNGSVLITYESNKYKYEYQESVCKYYDKGYICKLISDTDSSKSITAGDKYECKVNLEKDAYNFYVLTTPSKDSETINLIMDRNICEDGTLATSENKCTVAWMSDLNYGCGNDGDKCAINDKGPVTAMTYLYNATKDWINISPVNYTYNDREVQGITATDRGYTSFASTNGIATITPLTGDGVTIGTNNYPLRARMPIYSINASITEVADSNGNNNYLYDNLDPQWNGTGNKPVNNISGIYGYWTLSSGADNSIRSWYVYCSGSILTNRVSTSDSRGVRPVITVQKNKLTS